jgi:hypothetical protein
MLNETIAFVHLGQSIPRWLAPNLLDHKARFNNDVVLIVDNGDVARTIESFGINVWLRRTTSGTRSVTAGDSRTLSFRGGFWGSTSNRFVALAEFQYEIGLPVIQVETDTVLFTTIRDVDFTVEGNKLSFPLASWKFGLGSIVYFPSRVESSLLAEHFLDERSPDSNPTTVNDMTRLANFFIKNPEVVNVLPTATTEVRRNFFNDDLQLLETVSGNEGAYAGIFDALTIGQFLTGQDPRNGRGMMRIGANSRGFYPLQPAFLFRHVGSDLFVTACNGRRSVPVYNIHVHSKDLAYFSEESRNQALEKRILSQSDAPSWVFRPRGLMDYMGETMKAFPSRISRSKYSK